MYFETLKTNRRKKYLIGIVVFIAIMTTISLVGSKAKYRVTESIPIAKGKITNYKAPDLNAVAMYQESDTGYQEINDVPTSGYVLNTTESYCGYSDGKGGIIKDNTIPMEYSDGIVKIGIDKKGTKCYLYFDEKGGIEILANVDGSSSSTFPTKTSNYTPKSVSCTNGATAKFDYTNWEVEVDSVDKTTCTVDFETNKNQAFATYLKSKVCSTTPTTDAAAKDCLVNENGYRYEGSDPNNFVLFNDELWRVIGVFNVKTSAGTNQELVKLIRNDVLDGLAWHGSNTNDWSVATLQQQLNNGYLNATDTTCNVYSTSVTKTCKFSRVGLNSTARGMVESVVWNLGGYSSTSVTTEAMYGYERGTTVYSGRPTEWTGKVALMYPSDYGYASLASSCARTTNLGSYNKTACAGSNWLKQGIYQWTLTPDSSSGNGVFYVYYSGTLSRSYASGGYGARPSIYLKSNITIKGGVGSYENPYIIS